MEAQRKCSKRQHSVIGGEDYFQAGAEFSVGKLATLLIAQETGNREKQVWLKKMQEEE